MNQLCDIQNVNSWNTTKNRIGMIENQMTAVYRAGQT